MVGEGRRVLPEGWGAPAPPRAAGAQAGRRDRPAVPVQGRSSSTLCRAALAQQVAAVLALRRQSSSWLHIAQRSLPLKGWRQEADTPQWQREPAFGHYAMKPGQHEGTERADGRASGSH